MNTKQDQSGGDGAINVQAAGSVTIISSGLSAEDVKTISLDVFKSNAAVLAASAKQVAENRVEEMTELFLEQLQKRNPEALNQAVNPDFQMALLDAQKAYARTGDKDLAQVLIDLLVNRTQHQSRTFREIVLSESLQVVPRLTAQHINTISVIFILRHTSSFGVNDLDGLKNLFMRQLAPFVDSLVASEACYQHLAYSGAANNSGGIQCGNVAIPEIWRLNYPWIFSKGLPLEQYENFIKQYPDLRQFIVPVPGNEPNVQLIPILKHALKDQLKAMNIPDQIGDELWAKTSSAAALTPEVIQQIESIEGYTKLNKIWTTSALQRTLLTSVGIAIGHANFQRITGDAAPLSIWLPD